MLNPRGFAWIGLFAQDITSLSDFYENKVGLRLIESSADCHIFDAGAGALFEVWRNGQDLGRRKTPGEQSMIVGFLVDNLELAVSRLKERGLHSDTDIDSYLGTRWVYFTDPEGNRFELKDKVQQDVA
jgi:predicted enzyme related to lactoylglutathione lyase